MSSSDSSIRPSASSGWTWSTRCPNRSTASGTFVPRYRGEDSSGSRSRRKPRRIASPISHKPTGSETRPTYSAGSTTMTHRSPNGYPDGSVTSSPSQTPPPTSEGGTAIRSGLPTWPSCPRTRHAAAPTSVRPRTYATSSNASTPCTSHAKESESFACHNWVPWLGSSLAHRSPWRSTTRTRRRRRSRSPARAP